MSHLPPLVRRASARGRRRIGPALSPILLASVGAAAAWVVAHRLLGHPEPFFAPIAAAISLSTSRIRRSRRIVQMVAGVLLGIAIGEVLSATLGSTTGALAVIVFLTMAIAVLSGIGFVGEGMMFANQAAASAILVVTLHKHGTGSERAIDAIVGGAVAFVLGVVMFPAEPLTMLREAERSVLAMLAGILERTARIVRDPEREDAGWVLTAGHEVQGALAGLAQARATAHANVRVAPRRWHLRSKVDGEIQRTAQLDLLAAAVLGLVRTATTAPRPLPAALQNQIDGLGATLKRLGATEQPWPPALSQQARVIAAGAIAYAGETRPDPGAAAAASLAAAGSDLSRLLEVV